MSMNRNVNVYCVFVVPKDEPPSPVTNNKEPGALEIDITPENHMVDESNSFTEAHFSSSEEEEEMPISTDMVPTGMVIIWYLKN